MGDRQIARLAEPLNDVMFDLMERWLDIRTAASSIPGVSVALAKNGSVCFAKSFGFGETENNAPFTPETQIDVASQTKLLTLVSILRLHERNLLDLHNEVSAYIPHVTRHLPDQVSTLTLFEILTHQSGLPRDFAPGPEPDDLHEAINNALAWTGWNRRPAYSNVAFSLLGAIIESVSGESYADHATHEILEPIEMNHSSWSETFEPRRSLQYGPRTRTGRKQLKPWVLKFPGAVGLWSTPRDMCRLATAFTHENSLLSQSARARATAIQWGRTSDTDGREFALGLEVRWMGGTKWYGHSGGATGAMSATYFCPRRGYAFSVGINARSEQVLAEITESIATAIELFDAPASSKSLVAFEPFLGRYEGELGTIEIFATNSGCFFVDPSEWNLFRLVHRLRLDGSNDLRVDGQDFNYANMRLAFEAGPDGTMQALTFPTHHLKRCH